MTAATRAMSQCLARSFSCRYYGHEIDNGTVQMTFLACIPAAPHDHSILRRGGPISKRFPPWKPREEGGRGGTLKIIAATEFALLWVTVCELGRARLVMGL